MAIKAVHAIPTDLLCGHDKEEIGEHEDYLQLVCKHCLAELRVEKRCPDCNAPVISRVED